MTPAEPQKLVGQAIRKVFALKTLAVATGTRYDQTLLGECLIILDQLSAYLEVPKGNFCGFCGLPEGEHAEQNHAFTQSFSEVQKLNEKAKAEQEKAVRVKVLLELKKEAYEINGVLAVNTWTIDQKIEEAGK